MHKEGTTIIVKGDYVQEKHVQYQIGDVASGGIGVYLGPEGSAEKRETRSEKREQRNTPYENDYAALVEWLAAEKEQGRDWYRLNNCNRSAMCRQLTDVLGWVVDQNSLQKYQNRQK